MTISYSLFKSKFKKSIAESIYNEIVTRSARYYHWLGKENSWSDFLSPFIPSSDTDVPGPPQDNFRYDLHVRRDMLYTKLIKPSDVSFIVPRYDWESGTVYDMYDDGYTADEPAYSGAIRLEEAKFYVLTSEFNVYKCISNNYDSPSTQVPMGASSEVFAPGDGSDGYLWKFMYTIPISLRNKFLTSEFMPVSTALTSQFYANGAIIQVEIANGGQDYTEDVMGTGTISSDVSSFQVTGTGTAFLTELDVGYKIRNSAGQTVGIIHSIEDDENLTLTTRALSNSIDLEYEISATTVTVSGDGYLSENPKIITDIIFKDLITSGTFTVGETYVIDSIGTTDFTLIGASSNTIGETFIATDIGSGSGTAYLKYSSKLNPGEGYTDGEYNITFSLPTVTIGNEYTATGTITVVDGMVSYATITDPGYGYETYPILSVEPPVIGATAWAANAIYDLNDKVHHEGRYYNVSVAGQVGTVHPTHTSGSVVYGTATLTYIGRQIVLGTTLTNSVPDLDLIISSGEITGVIINNGGIAYSDVVLTVNGPTGTEANLNAMLEVGRVDTLQANVEQLAVPGTIEYIKVVNGGVGYSAASVTINGDGTGATATATVDGGRIVRVDIVNKGYGYTWTDVVITGNVGSGGALVRAIMSPLGGHGHNAVDELNASSIAFYSSVSKDILGGIEITNDYRKAGLIKNLTQFGSTNRFTQDVGSGCILITGFFDPAKFELDMLIQKQEVTPPNYKNYRIVEISGDKILVSVFNNFSISAGDVLVNENGDSILVSSVKEREIDQFSGELLFLTVREKYAPSEEQLITLKTIVSL